MSAVTPSLRRWTREEYCQIGALGIFESQRVELIEGSVIEMTPQASAHFAAVSLAAEALRATFGQGYWVRIQGPLHLGKTSSPEPDLAVVPGTPRDYSDHPTTALLIVEVSDTSLAYDRREKVSLYAKAKIADYWIINLIDQQLEIHRNPRRDEIQPFGFGYTEVCVKAESEDAAPLALPQAKTTVRDLLP